MRYLRLSNRNFIDCKTVKKMSFSKRILPTIETEQRTHEMITAQFKLRDLEPGATYAFAIKKTVAANDDQAQIETALRNYLGFYIVGGVPFVDVKCRDGRRHL